MSDLKHPDCPSVSHSTPNIKAVRDGVPESLGASIRHRGQELNISRCPRQRILTKDSQLHAYNDHLAQELKSTNHAQRLKFVEWIMEQKQQ